MGALSGVARKKVKTSTKSKSEKKPKLAKSKGKVSLKNGSGDLDSTMLSSFVSAMYELKEIEADVNKLLGFNIQSNCINKS